MKLLCFVYTIMNKVDLLYMSCLLYTGESSFQVKIEADSNDITEQPHDEKATIEARG